MVRTFKIVLAMPKGKKLPTSYRTQFHGFISNLFGDNCYKENKSKYSVTALRNGKYKENFIVFNDNPYFIVRIGDSETFNCFVENIKKYNNEFFGMEIEGIQEFHTSIERTEFSIQQDTPIRLGKSFENIHRVMTKNEIEQAEEYLVKQTLERAKEANVNTDNGLKIKIIRDFQPIVIKYHNILNNTRVMNLSIECDNELKEFILVHGLGKSNSCGFGFIY